MTSPAGEHRLVSAEGVPTCHFIRQKWRLSLSLSSASFPLAFFFLWISLLLRPITGYLGTTSFTTSSSSTHLCVSVSITTSNFRFSTSCLAPLVFDLIRSTVWETKGAWAVRRSWITERFCRYVLFYLLLRHNLHGLLVGSCTLFLRCSLRKLMFY